MRAIRASEISTYLYCQRAWGYRQQGLESGNLAELHSGQTIHARHGRAVVATGCLRIFAFMLLLGAVLLVVIYLAQQVV